jgi:hypothetical protein
MKIACIAYYTPPFAGVGQFRVSKFVKFLTRAESVREIHVVTVNEDTYNNKCADTLYTDEKVFLHRTKTSSILNNFFKEEGIGWLPYLIIMVLKLILINKITVIYMNGNPFLHMPVISFIASIFKVKVITDFRDPWLLSPYRSFTPNKLKIIQTLEQYVVKKSNYVINVTETASVMYREYYPRIKEKFITIENGFDKEDFFLLNDTNKLSETIRDKAKNKKIIVYPGKFSDFRDPSEFIKTLSLLRNDYFFLHIGGEESKVNSLIEVNNLENNFFCTGYIAYKDAISCMSIADIGLIISGSHPYEPTTKIFDFIALKLNKLVITPNTNSGFLFDALNEDDSSFLCQNQHDSISKALGILKEKKCQKESIYGRFDREKQSEELLDLLLN